MCHRVVFRGEKGFKKELCFLWIITFFAILKLKVLFFLKLGPIFVGPCQFMKYNNLLLSQLFYKIQRRNSMTELIWIVPLLFYFSASTYHYICVWFWGGQCTVSYIINQSKSRSSVFNLYICFCPFPARQIKRNVEIEELIFSSQMQVFRSTFYLCSLYLHNLFVRPELTFYFLWKRKL